ncbi:MAG: ISNCY family transposase [Anaerolineales bacterium]|jgi:IS5 family transposase
MLQDRHEIDKFFEYISEQIVQMDPVLAQIDVLLEDEALYQLMRRDFAKRYPKTEVTGRKSTPVEVLLRMLTVKRLYGLSYEQTEYQVRDSLVLRQFCRVYFNEVPDDTTLIRWANLIQAETLAAYNQRVTQLATELKVTQGRKLRTDGTVVESHIHPPSDSSLLADSVRVLGRTLQRAKQVLGEQSGLGAQVFRNRTRSAKKTARQVRRLVARQKEAGQQAYRKLVQITQQSVSQAKRVLAALEESNHQQAPRLRDTLQTFLPRAEQVIDQTVRRVFQEEKVPAAEKIVSIFEPHTAIIRRGKAGKPVEYGRKVWLDEVEGGIVTRWQVLQGNPSDKHQWLPSLQTHQQLFGKPPTQASADRALYSAPNEAEAQGQGVKRVVLPKPGKKSEQRRLYEKQPWFRRARKWHAGIEGRISVLKRCFDLDRCLNHGEEGFHSWVAWGVIVHNLRKIGSTVAARAG